MSIVFVNSGLYPLRPFTMITNTGVKSMIFFSMSMMSSWSFAPSMNSSSVISPVGSKVTQLATQVAALIVLVLVVCYSLPSPFTSILSNMSETISSGSMSLFLVMSWMACGGDMHTMGLQFVRLKHPDKTTWGETL